MVRTSRGALTAIGMLVVGLATACGGVSGSAAPSEPDVRKLEVGTYPVDAHTSDQSSSGKGALLEGIRMADAVAPTVRIDSPLKFGRGSL